MIRVLHFSDVHVAPPLPELPRHQMLNKRLVAMGNLVLRRGRKFRDGPRKLARLAELMSEERVDLVLNTGDYTALGTEPEMAFARHHIEPFLAAPLGLVTMPGNHDVYLQDSVDERRFERHFGALLRSDLPELATDGVWPLVRLFGDGLAVVCVNSARPNPQVLLSTGRVPDAQLRGLEAALADPRVASRIVIVATHYAPRLEDGRPDKPRHGLDNADELLASCAQLERGLMCFGHVHWGYRVRIPELRVPLFCAGSATHAGRESAWIYDVEDERVTARRVRFADDRYAIDPASSESWAC